MMGVNYEKPAYVARCNQWRVVRDCVEGDAAIRANITHYLPVPPGLTYTQGAGALSVTDVLNGATQPHNRYSFYATFAEYPDLPAETLAAIQGLIHEKPPTIELPEKLEYLQERATPAGDSLRELWEKITRELLQTGRIELLDEIVESTDELAICPYVAESLINWQVDSKREGGLPSLLVFKEITEEAKEGDDFEEKKAVRFRECRVVDGVYRVRVWSVDSKGKEEAGEWVAPSLMGRLFDRIPTTIINADKEGFHYGPIPLWPSCKRALSIFRKTADYNRALYVKGDPQAVLYGVSDENTPDFIGGGEIWTFPEADAKAEYLDIDGNGIPLMRESINDQYSYHARETGRLADEETGAAESGEAIRRRQAASHVTVKSMVVTAANSLQSHLRQLAMAAGLPENEANTVIFAPSTDFAEPLMSGKALLDYIMARNAGFPLSQETLHGLARQYKVTEKTYEDELAAISTEGALPGNEDLADEDEDSDETAQEGDDNAADDEDTADNDET